MNFVSYSNVIICWWVNSHNGMTYRDEGPQLFSVHPSCIGEGMLDKNCIMNASRKLDDGKWINVGIPFGNAPPTPMRKCPSHCYEINFQFVTSRDIMNLITNKKHRNCTLLFRRTGFTLYLIYCCTQFTNGRVYPVSTSVNNRQKSNWSGLPFFFLHTHTDHLTIPFQQ